MATSNIERVGRGLEILRLGLAPFIERELKSRYKERWWKEGVENTLRGSIGRDALQGAGSDSERFARLDSQALLIILWEHWTPVFQDQLGHVGRSYASELREVRNRWAHQQPFTAEDAFRALDTMARLLDLTGGQGRDELQALARELLRQRFETEARQHAQQAAAAVKTGASGGLKTWREVATPHPDVASGRYQQAEFAADLFQVITGRAEAEYGDPREFYRRTYLTEGLTRLLSRAWLRLANRGGDPVVELQTNFGGGKTHSMLALYHLFGGQLAAKDVPGLETIVPREAGLTSLPVARRAVLVGTQLSAAEVRTKPDGMRVHTLWGEMAWQLGQAAGDAAGAYALVAADDQSGTSPGSEKLAALFERCAPALVLIDEWVAFARQLYGKEGLPAGSFDANMTFAQALTEAAKSVPAALVVASIPASDIEIGGEGGRAALERIGHVFGRVEAVWKPATATESFEIVRRRLFQPITDYPARDAVCRAFAELYAANRAEFPSECREAAYESRLCSAYPIHPELFDRLYEDWSTLDRFQRTRGVLRLMAAIIHALWERQDSSLLIMPSTLPMDGAAVRLEVTQYLPEGWGAVVDRDVDGPQSQPLALDRANPNLGRYSACRRVARTIFVGSAPSVSTQRVRGIEEVRVKLGCVQPGESPAVFGDALRRLTEELSYLYSDSTRYWFDTRVGLTRMASDRAAQFERKPSLVEDEIVRRLRELVRKERADFAGVHVAPPDSADVPDEAACRLVILSPGTPHRARSDDSPARAAAQEILERRGNAARLARNMLVFMAADSERLIELQQALRSWLAWTSIQQDEDQLDLSATQKRQVGAQVQKMEETVGARMMETYCHLLVPSQDGAGPIQWTTTRLQGNGGLVARAARKLRNEQQLITEWSPALLRMELDRWLWKDQPHISVKQLWDYLCQYLYLSRLKDEQVLLAAIRSGAGSLTWTDFFAYAAAVHEDGHYVGLTAGALPHVTLDAASLLVKPDVARRQRESEVESLAGTYTRDEDEGVPGKEGGVEGATRRPATLPESVLRRFHGRVELDPLRLGRQAGQIAEVVVAPLSGLVGARVTITLEVQVEVPDGIPEDRVRNVTEDCNTLKFTSHGFEAD
jgi:predicted AAA+ superfamily ATPase